MNPINSTSVTRLTVAAVMTALAVALVMLFPIPMPPPVSFLIYDMADIPVLITAMLFGPVTGLATLGAVSLIQAFFTATGNGWVGFVMHFVSSGTLVVLTALFNRRFRRWSFTLLGMALGVISVAAVMIPLNLTLTVYFLGVPRAAVIELLPYIMLFNLFKPAVNCGATAVIIAGLSPFLRKSGRIPWPHRKK